MPRLARLDAPGVLHHVMGRGIEKRPIFLTDEDRNDFLSRLGHLAEEGWFKVYAWALLPNHFHLLCKTGKQPLARSMRRLLTGYVVKFNKRHNRNGHLFQLTLGRQPYYGTIIGDENDNWGRWFTAIQTVANTTTTESGDPS